MTREEYQKYIDSIRAKDTDCFKCKHGKVTRYKRAEENSVLCTLPDSQLSDENYPSFLCLDFEAKKKGGVG